MSTHNSATQIMEQRTAALAKVGNRASPACRDFLASMIQVEYSVRLAAELPTGEIMGRIELLQKANEVLFGASNDATLGGFVYGDEPSSYSKISDKFNQGLRLAQQELLGVEPLNHKPNLDYIFSQVFNQGRRTR